MFLHASSELKRTRVLLAKSEERQTPKALRTRASARNRSWASLFGEEKLNFAGLSQEERDRLGRHVLVALLITFGLSAVSQQVVFLLLFPVFLLWKSAALGIRARKRTEAFDKDYAALLLSLSSGVKTGLDPLVALVRSSELFQSDSVMRKELEQLGEAINEGASEEEAITRFGKTVRHPDLRLFHLAFLLARREGSSLSECLRRLARVTRQRQSFRRKIRSAVAMQKLSAFGIGGCAGVIGCIQFLGNPQAIKVAVGHPLGIKLLIFGLILILSGIVWMMRMSSSSIEER